MEDEMTSLEQLREPEGGFEPRQRRGQEPEPQGLSLTVRAAITAVLVVLAIVSAVFVADRVSRPEFHASSIESLDKKAETVSRLAAASTAASVLISAIPDDAGTPVAQKLVDVSADFAIVMAAIYLEKYLLTIFGLAAFRILVPVGLAIIALGLWLPWRGRDVAARLGAKLLLFGFAVALVVPTSIFVSDMIEKTYSADIQQAEALATQVGEAEVEDLDDAVVEEEPQQTDGGAQPTGFVDSVVSFVTGAGSAVAESVGGAVESVSTGFKSLLDDASRALNDMLESLAVLIVTNCVIPVLVLLFFIWLANTILGTDFGLPLRGPRRFRGRGPAA